MSYYKQSVAKLAGNPTAILQAPILGLVQVIVSILTEQ